MFSSSSIFIMFLLPLHVEKRKWMFQSVIVSFFFTTFFLLWWAWWPWWPHYFGHLGDLADFADLANLGVSRLSPRLFPRIEHHPRPEGAFPHVSDGGAAAAAGGATGGRIHAFHHDQTLWFLSVRHQWHHVTSDNLWTLVPSRWFKGGETAWRLRAAGFRVWDFYPGGCFLWNKTKVIHRREEVNGLKASDASNTSKAVFCWILMDNIWSLMNLLS